MRIGSGHGRVGWAKRSVPTHRDDAWARSPRLSGSKLCPPYAIRLCCTPPAPHAKHVAHEPRRSQEPRSGGRNGRDRPCRARRRAGASQCGHGRQECGAPRHGACAAGEPGSDPRRERPRPRRHAARGRQRRLPRPADADAETDRRDGGRHRGDRRARRPDRHGHCRMGPAERPPHRARAHAARRRRDHLREPAERHRRRRRALPQGRQRRDPARRLGFLPFVARDPSLPRRRPDRRRTARRRPSSWCRPATAPPSG